MSTTRVTFRQSSISASPGVLALMMPWVSVATVDLVAKMVS